MKDTSIIGLERHIFNLIPESQYDLFLGDFYAAYASSMSDSHPLPDTDDIVGELYEWFIEGAGYELYDDPDAFYNIMTDEGREQFIVDADDFRVEFECDIEFVRDHFRYSLLSAWDEVYHNMPLQEVW